jgi:hypothetical protein
MPHRKAQLCLLGSQVINEVAFGSPEVSAFPWSIVTIAILAVTYAIAITVPNIWPVMVSIPSQDCPLC